MTLAVIQSHFARVLLKARIVSPWPSEVDLDGTKVRLRGVDMPRWTRRALLMRIYEAPERLLVARWIKADEHVLELGASLGIVTSVICRTIAAKGRCVAVEANESLGVYFHRQIGLNSVSAQLINCLACPIFAGSVPQAVLGQDFVPSVDSLQGRARQGHGVVSSRWQTAGEICAATRLQPTTLVMDIEGAEDIWAEHPPCFPESLQKIIVELHPKLLGGEQTARVVSAVFFEGFELIDVCGDVFVFQRRPNNREKTRPGFVRETTRDLAV